MFGNVLVNFTKGNCQPCQMLSASLEKFTESHPDIKIVKVRLEAVGEEYFKRLGLRQTPSLWYFSDGVCISKHSGYLSPSQIEKVVFDGR